MSAGQQNQACKQVREAFPSTPNIMTPHARDGYRAVAPGAFICGGLLPLGYAVERHGRTRPPARRLRPTSCARCVAAARPDLFFFFSCPRNTNTTTTRHGSATEKRLVNFSESFFRTHETPTRQRHDHGSATEREGRQQRWTWMKTGRGLEGRVWKGDRTKAGSYRLCNTAGGGTTPGCTRGGARQRQCWDHGALLRFVKKCIRAASADDFKTLQPQLLCAKVLASTPAKPPRFSLACTPPLQKRLARLHNFGGSLCTWGGEKHRQRRSAAPLTTRQRDPPK